MLHFSTQEITELSNSIKILDVLEYYQLQPIEEAQGRWKLRCTLGCFDKTPSLKFWEETNSWYAYCCGEGGDPFQFIRLMEGEFARALEVLAGLGHHTGSVDDLIRKAQQLESLDVSTQSEQEQARIFALHYMLCVTHRDFLLSKKEADNYNALIKWVEKQYEKFDVFFDLETLLFEDAEKFYNEQLQLLKAQQ